MGVSAWLQRFADYLGQPRRVVSTGLLTGAVVVYLAVLVGFYSLPTLESVWPFLFAGGVFGTGYLRRDWFKQYWKRLHRRWQRFRSGDDDRVDESAHDWADEPAYDRRKGSDEQTSEETAEDGSWLSLLLFAITTAASTTAVNVLFSAWVAGLVLGAAGVIVSARLLALFSPVREGMAPARRGVPGAPSDWTSEGSQDTSSYAVHSEHSSEPTNDPERATDRS